MRRQVEGNESDEKIKIVMLSVAMILMGVSSGCSSVNGSKDGFYTAEMSGFSHG